MSTQRANEEFFITSGIRTITYPITDLARVKALYSALMGVAPNVDEAYYVGFRVGDLDIALLPPGLNQGMAGPIGYWGVDDIAESLKQFLDAGAAVQQEVKDVGGGMLTASVKDADGNIIGLIQAP